MEVKYFDRINKSYVEVEVNSKTIHFLKQNKKEMRRQNRQQGEMCVSLDALIDNGFQPASSFDMEEEIERRQRERKYLNSIEYRRFRKSLCDEILRVFDRMPPVIRKCMFLRFFKNMSIGQIATALKLSKSSAQTYLSRGCGYIKDFLEADIRNENRKEMERKLKRHAPKGNKH